MTARAETMVRWLTRLAVVVVALATIGGARAQSADEPALKAAFLHNFARFTQWPDRPGVTGPPSLCVLDNGQVARELDAVEKATPAGASAGVVRQVTNADDMETCALLYVGALAPQNAAALLRRLDRAPVLTVGDGPAFTRGGGIVSFYVENNRMRFAINVAAARRAGLKISSRLLSLATIVEGGNQ